MLDIGFSENLSFYLGEKLKDTVFHRKMKKVVYLFNTIPYTLMSTPTEKVTLSLNRELLEKMAKRSKKNLSQYVRDLIQREASMEQEDFVISDEIAELKGLLKADRSDSKERVHKRAIEKMRNYDR